MKKCTICKQDKDESEFNKNKTRKDGLNTLCKECSRKNSHKYYNDNLKYHKKQVRKRILSQRKLAADFVNKLRSQGCSLCTEKEACCIDFHHVKNKSYLISRLLQSNPSEKIVMEEINKCILLCANCHRKVHRGILDVSHIPILNIVIGPKFT